MTGLGFVDGALATASVNNMVGWSSSLASRPASMLTLLAALTLIPFAVVMLTSFSKMAIVFSLARTAMGSQHAPPTLVLTGLAAVLSTLVMAPVFEGAFDLTAASNRFEPEPLAVVSAVAQPLREFLVKHGGPEERARFVEWAQELRSPEAAGRVSLDDWTIIVPSFLVTELKEAFQLGFLVFLPFLVLDMLAASVLLALGMQTLSPTQVSLPFKLLLFVSVDGWSLLARGLILGYR